MRQVLAPAAPARPGRRSFAAAALAVAGATLVVVDADVSLLAAAVGIQVVGPAVAVVVHAVGAFGLPERWLPAVHRADA